MILKSECGSVILLGRKELDTVPSRNIYSTSLVGMVESQNVEIVKNRLGPRDNVDLWDFMLMARTAIEQEKERTKGD